MSEELNFMEWITDFDNPAITDTEVLNMYYHNSNMKVRDLAFKTGKSIGEVYRIIHANGSPNRKVLNHENVLAFASSGMSINRIAEFTGYTPRNVRYILSKHNDS